MTYPIALATKDHLDSGSDSPAMARGELAAAVDKINEIINVLDWCDARQFAGGLTEALASSATAGKMIRVSDAQSCDNLTRPTDREIFIVPGGSINPVVGKTFNWNGGAPTAGRHAACSGSHTNMTVAYPEWFGAGHTAMQRAVDAASFVQLSPGAYTWTEAVTIPDKNIRIAGYQSTINKTNGGYFFQQTKTRVPFQPTGLFEVEGVTFTGNAQAFHYDTTNSIPWGEQLFEFRFTNCKFLQDDTTYALWFRGSREGVVKDCQFENNMGIYRSFAIGLDLIGCNFKNTVYAVDDTTGSEGLKVSGGISLGVKTFLRSVHTFGTQIVGALIDYCDRPIVIDGSNDVTITGNYITGRSNWVDGATDDYTIPVIEIKNTVAYTPQFISIIGNVIINNIAALSHMANPGVRVADRVILIDGASAVTISGNTIRGYTTSAIEFQNDNNWIITGNLFRPFAPIGGLNAIKAIGTDNGSIRFTGNNIAPGEAIAMGGDVSDNANYVTENKGVATIAAGTDHVTVTHGLSKTPNAQDIMLTPLASLGSVNYWYVYPPSITATTFDVYLSGAAPAGGVTMGWRVKTGR